MDNESPDLAVLLRLARERIGLTQQELSESSGVSVRTISHLECREVARPRAATVRRLASALGLDPAAAEKLHMISRAHGGDFAAVLSRASSGDWDGVPARHE
ncbi:helix-turn-helix domain-containing protein [Kitasatospora sp. LaBMicrA B282]|uniref:helix-turn-helix domain-containing protein n=1 Tax=Kitasatospora sp. LaBMicrA B282 TaxID=3420949 RepID=UPI003D13186D